MRYFRGAASALLMGTALYAVGQEGVRFHDEGADTTRITELLTGCLEQRLASPGQRMEWFGRQFLGVPYVAHTLEGDSVERVTVNVDELDCTTFVETVTALTLTADEGRSSWRDFVFNLERVRYRGGECDGGYGSRLHYIFDWILDNQSRGNVRDVTDRMPSVTHAVKTLDFMTRHRENYPALSDSAAYARMRGIEDGLRNVRYPYVKASNTGAKEFVAQLIPGDILAFTTGAKDLDVTHLGLVVKDDKGVPHVMHASSSAGRVTVSDLPLNAFLKRNPHLTGVRVFRISN